jgi:L-ribulokinase
MAEHGVPVERIINGGGIPQRNAVVNQVYANVLNKPVLVPDGTPTSLGSCIFALLAAGAVSSVEQGQSMLCLPHRTFMPQPEAVATYERLFTHYRAIYFALGTADAAPVALGAILPELKRIAAETTSSISAF